MRPTLALALALLASTQALAGDFAWGTDLGQARARSAKENKPLLAVFRCQP